MRYKWLGSLIVFVSILGGFATSSAAQQTDDDDLAVTARYYGETLTHGGAARGGESYLGEGENYKMILAPNIGWYLHPRNHHGAFVDLEFGGRSTTDFGLFGDAFIGVGYFHRFPDGDIYQVEEGGQIDGQTNTGDPNFMPNAWLGIGWDFEQNGLAPMNVHVRAGGFGEIPFNHTILPHAVVQAGVTYKF